MGAGILDRVVLPTQIKNGNPFSSHIHKLAYLQVLKLASSPNLYKLSHDDLLTLVPVFFCSTFRRATLGLNSVPPTFSAPAARRAFHIPNRRKQAVLDTSETTDQPPIVRKDRTRTPDPR